MSMETRECASRLNPRQDGKSRDHEALIALLLGTGGGALPGNPLLSQGHGVHGERGKEVSL